MRREITDGGDMTINNPMQTFKQMFARAERVTCECGYDLTGYKPLQRLVRLGCPQCGSRRYTFDFSKSDGEAICLALGKEGVA